MTFACARRPTSEARPAAWKASPITYTPAWKYRTTWRGSIPSTVISAVGTPPSSAVVTVTSAGRGCADRNSPSARRCSLTSASSGKADCRRIASRFSRCSVLTEDLPSVGLVWQRSRVARPCQSAAEISCWGPPRVLALPSSTSETNGLSDEDNVDAAGVFLVDLENLSDLAVLPVDGVRPRIFERETVLDDPLTGL